MDVNCVNRNYRRVEKCFFSLSLSLLGPMKCARNTLIRVSETCMKLL